MNVSLYTAASGMGASVRWQEVIAENLAASSVPGFKKQDLTMAGVGSGSNVPAELKGAEDTQFVLPRPGFATNFAPGQFRFTGLNTDVAIEGSGFLEVQLPEGTLAYTRDGELQLDSEGRLVTKQGFPVMGNGGVIQLDFTQGGSVMESLSIAPGGEVAQAGEFRGRLRLVEFDNPGLLRPVSGGLFVVDPPGLVETADPTSALRQRWLEQSNTSVVTEMASLLAAMRAFETNQKVVQLQDERLGKVISELSPS